MPKYLGSGSSFERLALCPTSAALPHADFQTEYSERGTVIHSFLESIATIGRDKALLLVPAEWRDVCSSLVLEGLHEQLALAAEVAFAYNVETDTARELGRGEGRKYDDVTEDELPTTLDVVGIRPVAIGKRAIVIDWKSGWSTQKPIKTVQQLDVGALVTARAYGADVVDVQLVHVYENRAPWIQRRVIEGWEIDGFAQHVRDVWSEAKRQRDMMRERLIPRDFRTGPWCERCPAREFCPAQSTMLRAILGRDFLDGPRRMDPIPDDVLVDMYFQIAEAQSVLSMLKGRVMGIAASRTLHLGVTPDGKKDRWLGTHRYEGNDKLDGEAVFDVIASIHGDEVATAATKVVATKKDIDAAIMAVSKPREGAANKRRVYDELTARGAMTAQWKQDVKEYTTPVGALKPAPDLQLPPGSDEKTSPE